MTYNMRSAISFASGGALFGTFIAGIPGGIIGAIIGAIASIMLKYL